MLSLRIFHYWSTESSKGLVFPGIVLGLLIWSFLVFILFTGNNYSLLPRRFFHSNNRPSGSFVHVQPLKSQTNDSVLLEDPETSQDTLHYKYIINEPEKCQQKFPFLILLITVQRWQQEARHAIRQTWGREDILPGVHTVRLFLLGKDTNLSIDEEQALVGESQKYHDLIQQDFMDTYNNLTLKTLMGLEWVATYCPHVPYVMKTDSDMFVNIEYLINQLLKPDQPPRTEYFTGHIMRDLSPIHDKDSKWYMSPDLYPGKRYPTFCSGTGYVFSGDLAEKILNVSTTIKLLHLEDVFVGICLEKLGVLPVPPPKDSDFNHWKIPYSHCVYNKIVTSHQFDPDELVRYWNSLQQNKKNCI